ncbi:hypothetical protein CA13_51450 [Planctomycetes bacterium CA13]|uniref:Glycoside hydrolase family 42 N-terminal domain-containing protein n=1 Tax=Novipirellula herctigrandis TaxID=2527986 RepID=A0A5C5Z8X3_9BACT|nr:hypothetical protein CA13_51450 [Planctomycetes bacterium CA13]
MFRSIGYIRSCCLFVLLLCMFFPANAEENTEQRILGCPIESTSFSFLSGDENLMQLQFIGWGPDWSWASVNGALSANGNQTRFVNSMLVDQPRAIVRVEGQVEKIGPQSLRIQTTISTKKNTPLTLIGLELTPGDVIYGGSQALLTFDDDTTSYVEMPFGNKAFGRTVRSVMLQDKRGQQKTTLTFDPPIEASVDSGLRLILASDRIEKLHSKKQTMTITFPGPLDYFTDPKLLPTEKGFHRWFPFEPKNDFDDQGEIGLSTWLEKPAGKHGRISSDKDRLVYNGESIKLWGINLCYSACMPDSRLARRRAKMYAKYGINSVRLHKYADGPGWAGIQGQDSFLSVDADRQKQMDFFVNELKKEGIYTKLSPVFITKLGPGDLKDVPYLAEFGKLDGNERIETGHGSIYLSTELQDLMIRQTTNMLRHKNPFTGMRYADDPAIAVVELYNEDSALFFGTLATIQNVRTLRLRSGERFALWLKEKYENKAALLDAWGDGGGLNVFVKEGLADESWEQNRIYPAGNPWFFDPDQLAGTQASKRQRLLDTMQFLYELQNEFYSRFVKAIRETGYQGELVGSNWQAGRAMSHFYNLHSDAMVGIVDRHNYFGGGTNTQIENASMLQTPGGGSLSAGLQQVANRPFMLSEWGHVYPTQWGVEGPALIGAYGMGLQGWDVSYFFQNQDPGRFQDKVGDQLWEAAVPHIMGVFPAVARQVHRNDVKESDLVVPRYVHVPSLLEGKVGFDDQMTQQQDVKLFSSEDVPEQTIAVARTTIEFTDEFRSTKAFKLAPNCEDATCIAIGDQLRWHLGQNSMDGYVTIDTPSTKAVVGFARGQVFRFDEVTLRSDSRFAAVYLTAQGKDETIRSAKKLLIVAMARARNSKSKVLADRMILKRGQSPVVLEPVNAALKLNTDRPFVVEKLDHDGRSTGATIQVNDNGSFMVDGVVDKTPYYLVTFTEG